MIHYITGISATDEIC